MEIKELDFYIDEAEKFKLLVEKEIDNLKKMKILELELKELKNESN